MEIIRRFVNAKSFDKQWSALQLSDDDLKELQAILLENPKIGSVIQGTGRLRKMRYRYGNRGKSHCARVCYIDFEIHGIIIFVMVFAKNSMENLTKEECNSIRKQIDQLEKSIK